MAGDIEEPFRLNFQVDAVHSGSISFGRFESEALCWERRSSFSHNRYLEEVEKCSKPGSVTEKKAYFEAHFRKKGFLGLNSPECQKVYGTDYKARENDISDKMGNDSEIGHMNALTQHAQNKETEVFGASFSEHQIEFASDTTNHVDCFTEHVKEVEGDGVELESSLFVNPKLVIELTDKDKLDGETGNLDTSHVLDKAIDLFPDNHLDEENTDPCPKDIHGSSPKERTPPEAECMKPRLKPQPRVEQRRRIASSNASRSSGKGDTKTVPVRSKTEKAPEASKQRQMHETSKFKSSTSQQISGRVHQSANRVSPAVGANKPGMRQNNSRSSFKSNERTQRRKEIDTKSAEKMHAKEAKMLQLQTITQEKKNAEIKQLRKSLNFKALPMPSFYRGALCEPVENKAANSNSKPQKLRSKSSSPGIRMSGSPSLSAKAGTEQATSRSASTRTADPPQASATSCHSTVTSDSSASSGAGTCNHYPSQAGVSHVSKKKELEKEKLTNLRQNKVSQGNHIYKGKTFDHGEQRTRIGRSAYKSVYSSSRTRSLTVGGTSQSAITTLACADVDSGQPQRT